MCTVFTNTGRVKDTDVNRALSSLHGGSFKITLTVSLKEMFTYFKIRIRSTFLKETLLSQLSAQKCACGPGSYFLSNDKLIKG